MENESVHQVGPRGSEETSGATIQVPVPASNPNLYRHKATDELLQLLVDRPFEEYTIRTLASIVDVTHRTVGKAVDVLASNDLVHIQHKGNKKLVSINRERVTIPDNPLLCIPQTEFHAPVRTAVETLANELDDMLGILVYGSVARGEADRQSDIDLWVLVREHRGRNQRRAAQIGKELASQQFNGERYDFHIVVESPASVPAHTGDIAETVVSGITLSETGEFEKFQSIMEDLVDE
ncbi:nucleotidyltransferase domain-containing protein [Haladaptatus cibarius]|uniref:nucleotidyltransferase domain-containing protein n=1 Tax=Haladaptatus cibarius TaxID=453847 RepID=UPI0009FD5A8C|nr:nucleotidyltransferase domain-containing protein [Haladaptatus cibarius]